MQLRALFVVAGRSTSAYELVNGYNRVRGHSAPSPSWRMA